jgi:hypothetical protein
MTNFSTISKLGPIFAALFFFSAATALACTCEDKPSLDEAYNKASLIFVGQVKARANHPLREDKVEFRFAVTRKIKGFEEVNGSTVFIYTPRDHEYCGYRFQEGQDYLVYAEGTPANFRTTACTRTDVLDKALLDVQKLIRMSGGRSSDTAAAVTPSENRRREPGKVSSTITTLISQPDRASPN